MRVERSTGALYPPLSVQVPGQRGIHGLAFEPDLLAQACKTSLQTRVTGLVSVEIFDEQGFGEVSVFNSNLSSPFRAGGRRPLQQWVAAAGGWVAMLA